MVVFRDDGERPPAAGRGTSYPRAPGRSAELAFAFVYNGVRAMKLIGLDWLSIGSELLLHTLRTKQNARRGALTTSSRRSRWYTRAHKRFALAACARKIVLSDSSLPYTKKRDLTVVYHRTQTWPLPTTLFPLTTRPRPSPRRPSSSSSSRPPSRRSPSNVLGESHVHDGCGERFLCWIERRGPWV